MKKKAVLTLIAGAIALSLAACNNKSDNVQTEAATVASETEGPSEAAVDEADETVAETSMFEKSFDASEKYFDYESDFFTGEVVALDGNNISLKNDNGESKSFDLSGADCEGREMVLIGSYIEVEYPILEEEQKVTEAISACVLMNIEEYAVEMHRNPSIWGTIEVIDVNELQIKDAYGNECYFDNGISREISFGDIKSGTKVLVTYMGTLDKEAQKSDDFGSGAGTPYALKVVAEDAINTEEGQADYICGVVNTIENGQLVLDTEIMSLSFNGDASVFEGFSENDMVKVYYEGVVGDKPAEAVKVEMYE